MEKEPERGGITDGFGDCVCCCGGGGSEAFLFF